MRFKHIVAFVLVIIMLPSVFAGCAQEDKPASTTAGTMPAVTDTKASAVTTEKVPPATETQTTAAPERTTGPDTELATYQGVLREPQSFPPVKSLSFGGNAASEFEIVLPSDALPAEQTAAEELAKYIYLASGLELPVRKESDASVKKFQFILRGQTDGDLGPEGFLISFEGDALTIVGGRPRGVLYGVYTFLEEYIGCRFYTRDFEVIHEALAIDVPKTTHNKQIPVFEFRDCGWFGVLQSEAFKAKTKHNHSIYSEHLGGGPYFAGGTFVHTFDLIVPPSVYRAEHPEYYSSEGGQLCVTNSEVLEISKAFVRDILANDPGARLISVSQNDNVDYCMCESCMAAIEREGTPMGPLLEFVNAIAEDIKDDYPDAIIDTLAYQYTRTLPKTVRPLPNVQIRLCSIECHFTQSLEDPDVSVNADFMADLKAWSKVAKHLAIWDYTTNFSFDAYTFPNFEVLRQNARTFAEYGAKSLLEQGTGTGDSGEFGDLKAYLIAKLLWNPYMSEEEYYNHMDEFLRDYYGPGWQNIRSYIDFIVEEGKNLEFPIYSWSPAPALLIQSRDWPQVDTWWDSAKAVASPQELLHLEKSFVAILAMKMEYYLDLPMKISGGSDMYRKYKKLYEEQLERFNLSAGILG